MSLGYTKLFSSIVTSTIWVESDRTRIVWITMLAMADRNGEVQSSIPGLARLAGVPVPDCEEAVAKFLAPDPYSRTPDDEGRRIEKIEGGWALLNHSKYREMASRDENRAATYERVKRFREKQRRNAAKRSVTLANGLITQHLHIAEAEAEAEAYNTNKQGAPASASAVFPVSLNSPEFASAWADWLAYRAERKLARWKPRTVAAKLAELEMWGQSVAIESIRNSIRNGWQGIFEPKTNGQPKKPGGVSTYELEAKAHGYTL